MATLQQHPVVLATRGNTSSAMDHGIQAHLELEIESVASGGDLAYRIVNDGDRAVGYGAAGLAVERKTDDEWVAVPLASSWYAAWRRDISPHKTGPWMNYALPAELGSGRYRLVKSVHPPFEQQGVQPVVRLSAEFAVA